MITIQPGRLKAGNKWEGECPHCGCKVEANDKDIIDWDMGFMPIRPYVYCPDCLNTLVLNRKGFPIPPNAWQEAATSFNAAAKQITEQMQDAFKGSGSLQGSVGA